MGTGRSILAATWIVLLGATARAQGTQRQSVDSLGNEGNGVSSGPSISADTRYVAFSSFASNLVSGDTNGKYDVFVRERLSGAIEMASVDSAGGLGNQNSLSPSISANGRFVAFRSAASNFIAGDTNGWHDVFVRDRQNGTTERVSVSSFGFEGNFESVHPAISGDGRYVAFSSLASTLVSGDTNGMTDVFVRDRQTAMTERVSVASSGAQSNGMTYDASISADGRHVVFWGLASNLVAGDTNGNYDVFLRDRQLGTTERVSVAAGGAQGNVDSFGLASISATGRYVAFSSLATNLVPGDTNGDRDTFVRDRQSGTTERVSVDSGGVQGDDECEGPASISADGRYVAFDSLATNLVAGDTNFVLDVFVRDRDITDFTSLCEPGVAAVIACPCSNPASGPGRGCDNSAGTGGASLSAAGTSYLWLDSLVFTTAGEMPAATSIVLQGVAEIPTGAVFGQGVRCAGGSLKRLYVKTASGGSITAPDFGAGDPTVSARSAALGDAIQPGQSRWYLVYYRDPIVLGGCPAASTFNATQTGRVSWWP